MRTVVAAIMRIANDRPAAEVGKQAARQPHAGQNRDVNLRVAEKPEEMQPEQRGAIATGDDLAADPVTLRDEERGAQVAVA